MQAVQGSLKNKDEIDLAGHIYYTVNFRAQARLQQGSSLKQGHDRPCRSSRSCFDGRNAAVSDECDLKSDIEICY